jgi:Ca2+-transporting ATPase
MLLGGLWSATVNLGLFASLLATGRPLSEAMTMTFLSLVLIQFFKAYSFRSDRHSIIRGLTKNRWLHLAIVWELCLLLLIIYAPPLQKPFGTIALAARDWALIVALASSVIPVLEMGKWVIRRGVTQ